MLGLFRHFKEKMAGHYSVMLLILGCVTGLCAAWIGWGVIGVFILGMAFAKTFNTPDLQGHSWLSAWPSRLLSEPHVKHTSSMDLSDHPEKTPNCIL
ncbi:hypothetical protein N9C31_02330 [Gammaproteobacteria bacterium]|nr:hypothetical protein [Gammaproteobacteria bacterium]